MPSISVIVPVYKVEPYLRRCVESILTQTFNDFELILVDDGSPDNCGAICDEYAQQDPRVHVIHQQNGGLSAARNAGIDWAFTHSSSQWLTFVDSDDWIHPETLGLLHHAAVMKNVNVSVCDFCRLTKPMGPEISASDRTAVLMSPEDFWCKKYVTATIACCKLYRKEAFQGIRYPVGKLHEDEFTTYKLLFAEKQIAVMSAPLYCYFQNPDGIMRSSWQPKRMDIFAALAEQARFFENNGYQKALLSTINIYYGNLLGAEKKIAGIPNGKRYLRQLKKQNRRFVMRYRKVMKENWKTDMLEHAFPHFYSLYHFGGNILRALKLK